MSDNYSHGQGELDQDRSELFSGYTLEGAAPGSRLFDGVMHRKEPLPSKEDDEDADKTKKQTRYVKEQSAQSASNALKHALETDETAKNTLGMPSDQTGMHFAPTTLFTIEINGHSSAEKLENIKRHLDVSKGYSIRADDKTEELETLNQSPAITFNKDAERTAQEAKLLERHNSEREKRDLQDHFAKVASYGGEDDGKQRKERKRFQFESTESDDDELEDCMDSDLEEIKDATERLKSLATAMNQDSKLNTLQVCELGKLEPSDNLDERIARNRERVGSTSEPCCGADRRLISSRKSSRVAEALYKTNLFANFIACK